MAQVEETTATDADEPDGPVSNQSVISMHGGSEYAVNEKITTVRRRTIKAKQDGEDFVVLRGPNGRVMFNAQLIEAVEEKS